MKAICFLTQQIREDESMRNIAFSILLLALAAVQIAVVSTELSRSRMQTAAARNADSGARVALASSETAHTAPAF